MHCREEDVICIYISRPSDSAVRATDIIEGTSKEQPESAMTKKMKLKSDNYAREFARFITAIRSAEQAGMNTGDDWIVSRKGKRFPPIEAETLTAVADWYLDNTDMVS